MVFRSALSFIISLTFFLSMTPSSGKFLYIKGFAYSIFLSESRTMTPIFISLTTASNSFPFTLLEASSVEGKSLLETIGFFLCEYLWFYQLHNNLFPGHYPKEHPLIKPSLLHLQAQPIA